MNNVSEICLPFLDITHFVLVNSLRYSIKSISHGSSSPEMGGYSLADNKVVTIKKKIQVNLRDAKGE